MAIDILKNLWPEQRFEGYLFDPNPANRPLGLAERARVLDRKMNLHDLAQLFGPALLAITLFSAFRLVPTLVARTALALSIPGLMAPIIGLISLRLRHGNGSNDLSKEFLTAEKAKLEARIRFLKRNGSWYQLLLYPGLFFALHFSPWELLLAPIPLIALGICSYCRNKERITEDIQPLLDDINQRLIWH